MSSRAACESRLDVEERFAVVPEWLLDAEISDCSVRLYAVLLRYGQSSGARMPSRATLARRLKKKSTDTVDRALRELEELGAVSVEPRYSGRERLTNLYRVRTSRPRPYPEGGRIPAAGSNDPAGRSDAVRTGRIAATTVAASVRQNPEISTDNTSPPSSSDEPPVNMAEECGIADWSAFVAECVTRRRGAGKPEVRWTDHCLDAALQLAVRGRKWPPSLAPRALLLVAQDPESRSPMRLAEAGPWWDSAAAIATPPISQQVVDEADTRLGEVDGLRVELQRRARAELTTEGRPCTRSTVIIRAAELLGEMKLEPTP